MNIIRGDKPARFTLALMSNEWLSRSLFVFRTRTKVYLHIMLHIFIAIRGQMCTDGSHSKETKCVEDANAVDCNVASEVYLVECFVDAGRDLNEEEDDLEAICYKNTSLTCCN